MFKNFLDNTILTNWPLIVMIVITLSIVRFLYFKNSRQKMHLYRELMNLIFLIYIFLLFSFLSQSDVNSVKGFNLIPFREILRYDFGSNLFNLNIVGNVIVFLPLGFYIGYYAKSKKILNTIIAALLISLSVETVQYFIERTFDIDDIILNVLGAFVGYIIFIVLNGFKNTLPNFLQKDGLYAFICIIILAGLLFYSLNVLGVLNYI